MRILITGAAGFIGSHLADRLAAEGHRVWGVDDFTTGRRDNVGDWSFTYNDVGWLSPEQPVGLGWNPEVVIHAAASYKDPNDCERDIKTNASGTARVVRVAQHFGARLIYFQTALCYGNQPDENPVTLGHPLRPESSYAISKTAGEQYITNSGLDYVSFRLANICGPRNLSGPIPTFYKRLAAGEPCTVADTRRDFVYIDDLVRLVMRAVDGGPSGIYHASTGSDYSIEDVYGNIERQMFWQGRDTTAPELKRVERGPDDAPTIRLDPSKTNYDYCWSATTPLGEGIAKAVEWYREHGVEQTFTHLALKG